MATDHSLGSQGVDSRSGQARQVRACLVLVRMHAVQARFECCLSLFGQARFDMTGYLSSLSLASLEEAVLGAVLPNLSVHYFLFKFDEI